jgi:glycine/D-amino acid oxidase-like deaminating enzyme
MNVSSGQACDVAVIGGGIAGSAAAYYLARKGLSVVLLEKGEIAGEQSGRNWGFVRQQGRDPRELPPMMACNRLWQTLPATLEADIEWRRGGVLYLAEDEAEMSDYEGWLEHARAHDLDSRLLSGREAAALLPGMSRAWAGGLYTPSDGQADPAKTTRAFAAAAARLGAEVRSGCVVEAVETAGGAVTGLRTEAGEVKARAVLVAAGVWTNALLRGLGLDLPQLRVRATVLRTKPAPEKTALSVWSPGLGFRQRRDGSFNVAAGGLVDHDIGLDSLRYAWIFRQGFRQNRRHLRLRLGRPLFEDVAALFDRRAALRRRLTRHRALDPAPDPAKMRKGLAAFHALFPALADLEVDYGWAGVIEATPDAIPVLDALPGLSGLFVATGFSGHGFGFGPIAGRLMAELIAGEAPSFDLAAFRFARFAEGRALAPESAL